MRSILPSADQRTDPPKRDRGLRTFWSTALIPVLLASSMLTGHEVLAAGPTLTVKCLTACVNDTTFGGGALLIVSGKGFTPGQWVMTWLDANASNKFDLFALTEPSVLALTDSSGNFAMPLNVINVAAGAHQMVTGPCPDQTTPGDCINAMGQVSTPVTIAMTTSPYKFGSGSTLVVTGAGFAPGSSVFVWFDSSDAVTDSALDNGDITASAIIDPSGAFSTTIKINAPPGNYFMRAGPFTTATVSSAVQVATCLFQECVIDGVDTLCLTGQSPTDSLFFGFTDCKQVDFNYTKPTPATPNGGYDLSNFGATFVGAGALAAATNDLIPLLGCIPMQIAIANARGYGNQVPDADFDLFKPLTDLTDIACGDLVAGLPPLDLGLYVAAEAVLGHTVPDAGFLALAVATIIVVAVAAGIAAAAAAALGLLAGPAAAQAALTAVLGLAGIDASTAATIASAVGTIVAALGPAALAAAPLVTAAIILAAEQALAMLAVAGAIACGFVNYYCNGSDITANIMAKPDLQQELVPIPFMQPPFAQPPDPNPCRPLPGATPLNGTCWGSIIGWARVACKVADRNCETNLPPVLPNLPIPGTAGPANLFAPIMCATGNVVGLSIGYDGDISFDVMSQDPPATNDVLPLVNEHNFKPGPGGTDPPNGIDIEIPITQRPFFLPAIIPLRPGTLIKVCGFWVADMHMLWNELHPVTSLTILSDTSVSITSPAKNADLPTGTTTVTANITDVGVVDTNTCTVAWDGAAPVAATMTVAPTPTAPGTCVATTTGLAQGPHIATVSAQDSDSTSPGTASVSFTINAPPVLTVPGGQTVQFGGSLSFGISATDAEPGDTITFGSNGLPAGLTLTNNGDRTASVSGSPQVGVGSYTVTFTANDGINAPVSGTVVITVTPAPLTVTANDASRFYGQPNPAFSISATGLVNGDTLSALGVPTFTTAATAASPVGDYAIVPSGLTDQNYSITYVNGTLHVVQAPTATTLTATPNPSLANEPVTLTATVVTTAPGGTNPSGVGNVSFWLGSKLIGIAPLDSSGNAQLITSNLPLGDDALTALYSGTTNYQASQSNTVTAHIYDFTVALAPADSTVLRGSSTAYTVTLTLVPSSSSTGIPAIPITTSGLPADSTGTLSSGSVTPTLGGASTVLSVSTAPGASGSLGDFSITASALDPSGAVRSASAGLHIYDFSVTASPTRRRVLTTGSGDYAVRVGTTAGSSTVGVPIVGLTVSGLPTGATGSFSPGDGTPGYQSTLTIATVNAPAGTYNLTLTATDARTPEGGSRATPIVLVVITPHQALQDLSDQVASLQSAGVLNKGQANSLLVKLAHATGNLDAGKIKVACNQLSAFVNEVEALREAGILSEEQAASLVGASDGIEAVMDAIGCSTRAASLS
jgi:hypothetical protein